MESARTDIRSKIKEIIANVAGLELAGIGDSASFRDELALDSLALLEIGVDVDYAFHLNLPDEHYKELDSVDEVVALVEQHLGEAKGDAGSERQVGAV